MKTLFLILLMVLTMNQMNAQLQRDTEYNFQYAAAIKGDNINHVESQFTFTTIGVDVYWFEHGADGIVSLGKAYFVKKYDGLEGKVHRYQCDDVLIDFVEDTHGIAIHIIYGNKRIIFHNWKSKEIEADIVRM